MWFHELSTENSVFMHIVFCPNRRKIVYSWTYFPSLLTENHTNLYQVLLSGNVNVNLEHLRQMLGSAQRI